MAKPETQIPVCVPVAEFSDDAAGPGGEACATHVAECELLAEFTDTATPSVKPPVVKPAVPDQASDTPTS